MSPLEYPADILILITVGLPEKKNRNRRSGVQNFQFSLGPGRPPCQRMLHSDIKQINYACGSYFFFSMLSDQDLDDYNDDDNLSLRRPKRPRKVG